MKINIAKTIEEIDFEFINSKIASGKKIRIDIGTSINAPISKYWLDNEDNIFVIGFEPNPNCVFKQNFWNGQYMNICSILDSHPKREDYYHIICGLDNVSEPTKADLFLTTNNTGCSSLLEPIIQNISGCELDGKIPVQIISAKWFLDKLNYKMIEMVKIDAQGKDLDIVSSFDNHIKNVIFLDIEGDSTRYYINAPDSKKILGTLDNLGFQCYHNLIDNYRFINTEVIPPKDYNNKTGEL